ncbi:aspartic peptidase domain-containing protein [Podospora didyma]|uniref:Aspartic peptidase domain-containing protein n=1 Tax=Podospora didyma TaxID=330526 RepID=A0AAE0U6N0_9PEZI|nr:aspartic peptidase domain-containing protein [Podospora didyma]
MKLSSAISLALALWASKSAQQHVQFDLKQGLPIDKTGLRPRLAQRATTYAETLINNITDAGYYAKVYVGTPGQEITMLFDTGSSDTWVVGYRADLCINPTSQQLRAGLTCMDVYNPNNSTTYKLVRRGGFAIKYIDGSTASGDYISDNLSIGGANITSLQIGYAIRVPRGFSIMGVGFSANVATRQKYPNIIDQLYTQGLVSSKAYSLYLNDQRADSGTILFGGLDTDKFIGPLTVLPILKAAFTTANYTSFEVSFSGLSLNFTNGTTSKITTPELTASLPAILDSGTTLSYLPDSIALPIYDALGAVVDTVHNLAFVDCDLLRSEPNLTITFTFGSDNSNTVSVAVPGRDMILDVLDGYPVAGIAFARICLLGIQSISGFEASETFNNFALLGGTFLRSAYVVYDLDHNEIGLAQANLNSTISNIIELKANASDSSSGSGTGLPKVTGVRAQQTTSNPTSTSGPRTSSGGGGSGGGSGGSETSGLPTVTVTVGAQNAAGGRAIGTPGDDVLAVMAITLCFALVGAALL